MPSEVLTRATTFDLYVLDVGTRWINYKHELAQGKSPVPSKSKQLTQKQLMEYMALAKKAHAEREIDENK